MSAVSDLAYIHVRRVPADLWRRAKIEAASRGITVREIVINALTDYLPQDDSMIMETTVSSEYAGTVLEQTVSTNFSHEEDT